MGDFLDAALSFPTVLFSFLLVVVVGYWLLVLLGGAELDGDGADGADGAGLLGGLGLGGVPAAVVLSLLITFTWFASLAGSALLDGGGFAPLLFGVLAAALVAGWIVTRLLVLLIRRALPAGPPPSRADFIGATCVIRTGRVDDRFGQAEVTAPDGSSALVQVRQAGADPLRAGSAAMIYDFDPVGEFFWVVPADAALHPDPRHPGRPGPRRPDLHDPDPHQV